MVSRIRVRNSCKWSSLLYFNTSDIILATFGEADFYQDIYALSDCRHHSQWENSFIGEDIIREFDRHPHKIKVIFIRKERHKTLKDHIIRILNFTSNKNISSNSSPCDSIISQCCNCNNLVNHSLVDRDTCEDHIYPNGSVVESCYDDITFDLMFRTQEWQRDFTNASFN
jgi:hypothetical protein